MIDHSEHFLSDAHLVDLDQDGDQDLVLLGLYPGLKKAAPLHLVINDEKENFHTLGPLGQGSQHARDVATGDFNGDGKIDFVVADHGYDQAPFAGAVSQFIFQGPREKYYSKRNSPWKRNFTFNISAGDVNGDKLPDLYFSNLHGPVLYLNAGKGNFTAAPQWLPSEVTTLKKPFMSSHLFDFDNDGDLDLYLGGKEVNAVDRHPALRDQLFINKGDHFSRASFEIPPRHGGANWGTAFIDSADFNGDGYQDLVLTTHDEKYQTGTLQVLINQKGTGFRSLQRPFEFTLKEKSWFIQVSIGDVNGDGHLDLFTHKRGDHKSKDNLLLFLNLEGKSFKRFPLSLGAYQKSGFLASHITDWDSDGLKDLIAIDYQGQLILFKNLLSAWPQ